ncbi:MAG: hypothetical protein AAF568_09395 [Pseudomonadota bacterium]
MSDEKQPQEIADQDLEGAEGGVTINHDHMTAFPTTGNEIGVTITHDHMPLQGEEVGVTIDHNHMTTPGLAKGVGLKTDS